MQSSEARAMPVVPEFQLRELPEAQSGRWGGGCVVRKPSTLHPLKMSQI